MDIQEVKRLLRIYLAELKCELTGWDKSVPLNDLKDWIKKIETRIIKRIE